MGQPQWVGDLGYGQELARAAIFACECNRDPLRKADMASHLPLALFIVYARKDARLLEGMRAHLSLLRRQGLISDWHDRDINAGDEWRTEISRHLEVADLVLLLVSAYFLESDYCFEIEMQRALERHAEGSTLVVPIALRPADWSSLPIAGFQGLPTDLKAVTLWSDSHAAWADVAAGLRRLVEHRAAMEPTAEAKPEQTAVTERSPGPSAADARYWYRKGAERGDALAAFNLAVLLEQEGNMDDAEQFYRQAAEAGMAEAMNNLGLLLLARGNIGAGKHMLRDAIANGSTDAPSNLGIELKKLGELDEAEQHLLSFAAGGDNVAAGSLAHLYHQIDRPDEARHWYEIASKARVPQAMSNFGSFLFEHGEIAEAERMLRRGVETGHVEATFNLGVVLASQGRRKEAAGCYRTAADGGHLGAANNLGVLLLEDDNLVEAEPWLRRAAEGGHPKGRPSNLRAAASRRAAARRRPR